jgi:hypothetical protein
MYHPKILRDTATLNTFCVQSFTCDTLYTVTLPQQWQHWRTEATCTCPHSTEAKKTCKHIVAVIQRICERAPLRIRLNSHYYSREAHEPFFTNEERHSWNTLNTSRLLFDLSCRDAYDILTHPPAHRDVVNALLAEHRTFRVRADSSICHIAYQLDGACIATDCQPLTFTQHIHILTDAKGNQTYRHIDDLPAITWFRGMVQTHAYARTCNHKTNLLRFYADVDADTEDPDQCAQTLWSHAREQLKQAAAPILAQCKVATPSARKCRWDSPPEWNKPTTCPNQPPSQVNKALHP